MNIQEKLRYLQDNYFGEWLKTREKVEGELSDNQTVECVCGHLATGLHESNCKRFQNKVLRETVKRLNYLIKK
jgi:hypothetical protein